MSDNVQEMMRLIDIQGGALNAYEELINRMGELSTTLEYGCQHGFTPEVLMHAASQARLAIICSDHDIRVIGMCQYMIAASGAKRHDLFLHNDGRLSGRYVAHMHADDVKPSMQVVK